MASKKPLLTTNNRTGLGFVARFALLGLAGFLATGLLLGQLIAVQMEKAAIADAASHAEFMARAEFEGLFADESFRYGLVSSQIDLLDQTLAEHHPHTEIQEMLLRNAKGTIVYSTDKESIGKHLPVGTGLKESLDDKVYTALERPGTAEQPSSADPVIHAYTPVHSVTTGEVIGVFEARFDVDKLLANTNRMKGTVWLVLASGFTLLYVFLSGFVARAARAMVAKKELEEVNASLTQAMAQRDEAEAETRSLARFPSENPDPVLRVSEDGTVLYSNPATERVFGSAGFRRGRQLPSEVCKFVRVVVKTNRLAREQLTISGRAVLMTFQPLAGERLVNIYAREITETNSRREELVSS